MGQDEIALRRDIGAVSFIAGVKRGKWEFLGLIFPFALFSVTAAQRPDSPNAFMVRVDCSGYSATAPTLQLWHGGTDSALHEINRPQSGGGVMGTFKVWEGCFYHPIDRIALGKHPEWHTPYPDKIWTPDKDITFLLETLHELLNSDEYTHAVVSPNALSVPPAFVA